MLLPGIGAAMMAGIPDAVSGFSVGITPGGNAARTAGFTDGANHTLATSNVTAAAAGGSGAYTYAWARVSGDSAITAGSPTAAVTNFSATLSPNDIKLAVFRVTATDTGTGATATHDVTVALHYVDLS